MWVFTSDVCRFKAVQVGLHRLLGGIAGVDPRSSSFSNWPLPHLAFLSTLAFCAVGIYAKKNPNSLRWGMSRGMGNYRQILSAVSRYLSITTHTPPKSTGVVTHLGCLRCQSRQHQYTLNQFRPYHFVSCWKHRLTGN